MTTDPQPTRTPAPAEPKSRLLQDGRDMFWSMAPLVLACIVLAGLLGMCSFQASGPGRGPTPEYNAPAALRADADALMIPIRVPQLPQGWQSNSGERGGIEAGRTDPATRRPARAVSSSVGYLAPDGMYIRLTQSNADEDKLVGSIDIDAYPTGTQNVDGVNWVVYEGSGDAERDSRPAQPVWTTRLTGPTGPAQVAITGGAGTDEFRTLAAATQTASPLPVR